jgi:Zn-finger nucleic acid-binding protein
MPCPACGLPLEEQRSLGVVLQGCNACGGVWLDKDQARAVTTHIAGSLRVVLASDKVTRAKAGRQPASARTRRCPVDAEPLTLVETDGVEVDVCQVHGTWFDADEVRRIANANIDSGKASVAAPAPESTPTPGPLSWLGAFVGAVFAVDDKIDEHNDTGRRRRP